MINNFYCPHQETLLQCIGKASMWEVTYHILILILLGFVAAFLWQVMKLTPQNPKKSVKLEVIENIHSKLALMSERCRAAKRGYVDPECSNEIRQSKKKLLTDATDDFKSYFNKHTPTISLNVRQELKDVLKPELPNVLNAENGEKELSVLEERIEKSLQTAAKEIDSFKWYLS